MFMTKDGVELYCPVLFGNLPSAEQSEGSCGSEQARFDYVPDTIWGLSVVWACRIHDYMYSVGQTIEDKTEADRVFLNNMLRIIEAQNSCKVIKSLRRCRANKYFYFVDKYGGPSFWTADKV